MFLSESADHSANTEQHDNSVSERSEISPSPTPPAPNFDVWNDDNLNNKRDELSEHRATSTPDSDAKMMQQEDEEVQWELAQLRLQRQAVAELTAQLPSQELEELKSKVPLDEHGQMSSLGSINHQYVACRPCLFQHTRLGCHYWIFCDFCHYRRHKARPCKGKRARYRRLINHMDQVVEMYTEPDGNAHDPSMVQREQEYKAQIMSKLVQTMQKHQVKACDEDLPDNTDENAMVQELPSSSRVPELTAGRQTKHSVSL